ncbi:hypothetical protein RhiJN_05026 [Ceratobasidium sp. AG-Ba]|nr:hypothetical protein RhiJN_05026 [Ceratobasidium sp. AG-Ba]
MTKTPPRKLSGRKRHPTERLSQYDHSQGALTMLARSIGRPETPPSAKSQIAARGKEQALVAACRGNTSRPGPLKPLSLSSELEQVDDNDNDVPEETMREDDDVLEETMRGEDDVPDETMRGDEGVLDEMMREDDSDGDSNDERALLDYTLDELDDEADRIEWLYQAIDMWGGHRNYREDPAFQDEASLYKEWKRLVMRDSAGHKQSPPPETAQRIQKGQTYVLKPQTTGHSSRVRLHRTDNETLALDGKRVGSEDRHEYGDSAPAKLARTDQTTIGLDGKRVSPPCCGPSSSSLRENRLTAKKRVAEDIVAPSKKRALASHAQVEGILRMNGGDDSRSALSHAMSHSLQSRPQARRSPSPDATLQDAPSDNGEPLSPMVHSEDWPPSPPASDDGEPHQSGPEQNSEEDVEVAGHNGDDPVGYDKLTKRQRTQLRAFSREARELVQWVFDKIKLNLATVCPFADNMTEKPEDIKPMLDRWIIEYWKEGNDNIREGKVSLPLKDDYAAYIRKQIPGLRNSMRKSCKHLVSVCYELRRSKPNHATLAKDLTDGGEERWLSSNKKNDTEMFMHAIIADTIENAFFKTGKSFGFRNLERFTPLVPIPTIAYACSIIRNRIKAFEVDISKPADLNSESDRDTYKMYMTMLENIRKENPAHLLRIRTTITLQYLPKPTVLPVPELNLGPDGDLPMDSLEEISELLGDEAAALTEWDGVKEALWKSKGKAPARGGTSRSTR